MFELSNIIIGIIICKLITELIELLLLIVLIISKIIDLTSFNIDEIYTVIREFKLMRPSIIILIIKILNMIINLSFKNYNRILEIKQEIIEIKSELDNIDLITFNKENINIELEAKLIKLKHLFNKEQVENFNLKSQLEKVKTEKEYIKFLESKLKDNDNIYRELSISRENLIKLKHLFNKEQVENFNLKSQLAKRKHEEQQSSNKCSICLENDLDICCVPCGHTYCNNCIVNSNKCFICRGTIIRTHKIFI